MGIWGEFEHENDNFLDYVGDDSSVHNLLKKLKKNTKSAYIVGIYNLLKEKKQEHLVPKRFLQSGIKYLKSYDVEDDVGWKKPNQRKKAVETELKNMTKTLESLKSPKLKSKSVSKKSPKKSPKLKSKSNLKKSRSPRAH